MFTVQFFFNAQWRKPKGESMKRKRIKVRPKRQPKPVAIKEKREVNRSGKPTVYTSFGFHDADSWLYPRATVVPLTMVELKELLG